MKGIQINQLGQPSNDEDAANKKYVDNLTGSKTAFNKKKDKYEAKGSIYLKKNRLSGLREPIQAYEAATKKYVDDQVVKFIDERGNIFLG